MNITAFLLSNVEIQERLQEAGQHEISQHAMNSYKERVTDDPLLARRFTAIDIERRIRSGVKHAIEGIPLDGAVAYKTRFTRKGAEYYVIVKENHQKAAVSVWSEEIYHNYIAGVRSDGSPILEHD